MDRLRDDFAWLSQNNFPCSLNPAGEPGNVLLLAKPSPSQTQDQKITSKSNSHCGSLSTQGSRPPWYKPSNAPQCVIQPDLHLRERPIAVTLDAKALGDDDVNRSHTFSEPQDEHPSFRSFHSRSGIKLFSSSDEVIPVPEGGKYFRLHRYYYMPDLTRGKVPFKVVTRRQRINAWRKLAGLPQISSYRITKHPRFS